MPKPFDATLNSLIDAHLDEWAAFLAARAGAPPPVGPAEALDTDLSATLQADRLFRVGGAVPYALHLELESSGRLGIPEELLRYNVAARAATGLPVLSVLVLLRSKATATDLDGELQLFGPNGTAYLTFRYAVVRLWRESFDVLLNAGVGLAPLALLTNEAAADLPAAFGRFAERVRAPGVRPETTQFLLGSTFVLSGLRYADELFVDLYRRLDVTLEDSTTYQWILRKGLTEGEARGEARGAVEGRRAALLQLGTDRFGEPSPDARHALDAVADIGRLARMTGRLFTATDWDDLLATE